MSLDFEKLKPSQQVAFMKIADHLLNKNRKSQFLRLDAPAGRGKTFLTKMLLDFLIMKIGYRASVLAFTGRAASHLRRGGISASTFHKLLLEPVLDQHGDLLYFKDRDKSDILSDVGQAICIDEGSMVPKDLFEKVSCLGLPIIILGDIAQLEAVQIGGKDAEKFNLMTDIDGPLLTLDENVRFSEDSGIGWLADHLRKENSIPRKMMQDLKMVPKNSIMNVKFHEKHQFDCIVCGTNKVRKRLNSLVRHARGFDTDIPSPGETIICLKNDIVGGNFISNGELFEVISTIPLTTHTKFIIKSLDNNDNEPMTILVENECWEKEETKSRKFGQNTVQTFGFGYAMSCHKVQGSTVKKLLFVDEDVSYFIDQQKYRYTGVSRASELLYVAI